MSSNPRVGGITEFTVRGKEVRFYRSNRAAGVVTKPQFVQAGSINNAYSHETVVLIVTNSGEYKAYPLMWLDTHELVRDTVGGLDLLITYCGLTHSPVVYNTSGDFSIHAFEDSGYVYESNLVIRDLRTGSFWQQFTGECLTGVLAGNRLVVYPSFVATFGNIKKANPKTLVVVEAPAKANSNYTLDILPSGLPANLFADPIFPISSFEPKLSTKERIIGFTSDNVSIALPLGELPSHVQSNTLGGLTFRTIPYLGSHMVEALTKGREWKPLNTQLCFWFAWYLIHSNSFVLAQADMSRSDP